jgi:uncharacterized membrane protein
MKYGMYFIMSLIVMTSICDTISQLFLKSSINSLDLHINSIKKIIGLLFKLIMIPRIWIGFLFSTLSLVIWLFVLSKADLNLAFSLDSMHYIFIAFGSMFLLKEKIGVARWLGIISIVAGIMLVSIS